MTSRLAVFFLTLTAAAAMALIPAAGNQAACAQNMETVTDAAGRTVAVPVPAGRMICSGPGCLRLAVYLQATEQVIAVDSMEKDVSSGADPRPYALAHPELRDLPMFGEFRGMDNPELIAALDPQPEVIFKTFASMGHDPGELQKKTGIPVIVLQYGNLTGYRHQLDQTLKIMGRVLGKTKRAEEIIQFFDNQVADLARRTADVPQSAKPDCYVGGISYKGPHGFRSTEPDFPPFEFTRARHPANSARPTSGPVSHAQVAREQILVWNPEILFLDLAGTVSNPGASALDELHTDPAYQHLDAVDQGRVFGLMPYNWYARNFGAVFANAWYVGKKLYPEKFSDIDPAKKADQIFSFLVGRPVFDRINAMFGNRVFEQVMEQKGD